MNLGDSKIATLVQELLMTVWYIAL